MPPLVLTIPELLGTIFQFLDQESNTANALVCKQWSDIALDSLWQEVNTVARLFNILAPLEFEPGEYNKYNFTRKLEFTDWQRFDRYRFRVRRLYFNSYSLDHSDLVENVYNEVARTRTSLVLCPNLHTLEWFGEGCELEFCTIFIHENVNRFAIGLAEPEEDNSPFLRDVGMRMPHLTHFECRSTVEIEDVEPELIDLLPRLTRLKELSLTPLYFTTKVAEAAAYNPDLESINMTFMFDLEDQEMNTMLNPQLTEGAYPSLSKLTICIAFRSAAVFLSNLPALTNLHLSSPLIEESPTDVAHLITKTAKNCQHLRSLTLAPYKTEAVDLTWTDSTRVYDQQDCITLDNLRSLFQFQNLVHFDISHGYPLLLLHSDIEEIAKSMPNVETLILNSHPLYTFYPSNLHLDALLPFAHHCRRLHMLGLYMNAVLENHQDTSQSNAKYPVFRALRRLSVGFSTIEDKDQVSNFLDLILPRGCVVESAKKSVQHKKWVETMKALTRLRKIKPGEKCEPDRH